MAAILKIENCHISNGLTDWHEIWHNDENWTSESYRQLKFQFFLKFEMTDDRHIEKSAYMCTNLTTVVPDLWLGLEMSHVTLTTPLSRVVCRPWARTYYILLRSIYTKFEVCLHRLYTKIWKETQSVEKDALGVVTSHLMSLEYHHLIQGMWVPFVVC